MTCDRCEQAEATVCVWDEPENASGLMFGDELLGRLLCGSCLRETEADGPWHGVEVLDEYLSEGEVPMAAASPSLSTPT